MPLTGTLRNWNDERGFGFIAPTHGGAEIFVHVSAFPRDGSHPTVGERLEYELGRGRDGKPQAVRVVRLAVGASAPRRAYAPTETRSGTNWLGALALLAMLAVGGAWGFKHFSDKQRRKELAAQPAVSPTEAPAESPTGPRSAVSSRCDGRVYCSQMTSCAEAKWFINNCPGTKMDGNNDGVPCQEQWCN